MLGRLWNLLIRLVAHPATRVLIAILTLTILVRYNRIDAGTLSVAVEAPTLLLLALMIVLPTHLIVAYRFKIVLRGMGIAMQFRSCFSLTMIGAYFDLTMPSSNGGDVIKAAYLLNELGRERRYGAVMAVGVDRILGVIGLFTLALLSSLVGWQSLAEFDQREALVLLTFTLSLLPLLVFLILGSARLIRVLEEYLLPRSPGLGRRLLEVLKVFNVLRQDRWTIPIAIALSMLNHIFWCAAIFLIVHAVGNSVSLFDGLLVFPLAIFGGIFGVAGGFGLGTAAFDAVFATLLGLGGGATIGLIFQIVNAAARLLGLPFFLYTRPRLSEDEEPSNSPSGSTQEV